MGLASLVSGEWFQDAYHLIVCWSCVGVLDLHVCLCTVWVHGILGGQKWSSDPLDGSSTCTAAHLLILWAQFTFLNFTHSLCNIHISCPLVTLFFTYFKVFLSFSSFQIQLHTSPFSWVYSISSSFYTFCYLWAPPMVYFLVPCQCTSPNTDHLYIIKTMCPLLFLDSHSVLLRHRWIRHFIVTLWCKPI